MSALRVGIVGAGNISSIYCENLGKFPSIDLVGISDLDTARAQSQADKYGIKSFGVDELIEGDAVDLILNITIPAAHGPVALRSLENGKHVYNEKPLSVTRDQARELNKAAAEKGLRVGCAPDTFLGAGHQKARKLIEEGIIGIPVAVHGYMISRGVENWHPNPEFFYKPGGGPMLDMGPYYLTAFVNLFGAIDRLAAITRTTFAQRTIGSEPLKGQVISVETPTSFVSTFQFESGVIGNLTTSFDAYGFKGQPNIVVFGTEGSMLIPDPNSFAGWDHKNERIRVKKGDTETEFAIEEEPFKTNSRGLGILDIAHAIEENRPHRASGELAFHVLDAMLSSIDSSADSKFISLENRPAQPTLIGSEEFPEERSLMG